MHQSIRKLVVFCFFMLTAIATTASAERPPFKCPTYIDTVVPAGQDGLYGKREAGDPFLDSMLEVHNTLSNCSTIKSLKLRVTGLGCSEWPDRYNFPLEHPSGSRYHSQLESLDLEGYEFNERPWQEATRLGKYGNTLEKYLDWVYYGRAWTWLKGLPLSQEKKDLTNLDLWLEAMDFSKIERLAIEPNMKDQTPNTTVLVPHLKSLRSFTTSGPWAKDLILSLPPNSLNHLSWVNSGQTGSSVQPMLRHHAASLTTLDLREPETTYRQRRVMTQDQLSALGSMAPNLRSLTLDINQNRTWGWDHLEALATKFPNLENATIFFEEASECRRQLDQAKQQLLNIHDMMMMERKSECKGPSSFADPHLSIHTAREPFEFLFNKNVATGGKLKKVAFYSGGWQRPWDGAVLAYDAWMDHHQSWAVCEVLDGTGEMVKGINRNEKVEVGDKLLLCQNERHKWHKVVSQVEGRGRGWDSQRSRQENQEILQRAMEMEL